MDITILGIESSCDDTSAAVIRNNLLLSNVIASQAVHIKYGGVIPEIASRAHAEAFVPCVSKALVDANMTLADVDAIAVSAGPGLAGCLAVGVSGGKDSLLTLAALAQLRRFYPVPFNVHAITLETGTPGMSFDAVADLCRDLEVPYTRISVPVYQIVFEERKEKNPCSLCAKLRRGSLNTALKDLGISKTVSYTHLTLPTNSRV